MAPVIETVHVGGQVPADLAEQFVSVAKGNERSVAAELRLAIKAHIEREKAEAAA